MEYYNSDFLPSAGLAPSLRLNEVDVNEVQASPTRQTFLEIQNIIPSTAVRTPTFPIHTAGDGAHPAASDQNLPWGNTSIKPNALPCRYQSKSMCDMGMPQPEAHPGPSDDTPLPTFTDEEKELMLQEYYAMFDAVVNAEFDAMKVRTMASIMHFDAPFPTFSEEEMALKVEQFNASLEGLMSAEPEAMTPVPDPVPTTQGEMPQAPNTDNPQNLGTGSFAFVGHPGDQSVNQAAAAPIMNEEAHTTTDDDYDMDQ